MGFFSFYTNDTDEPIWNHYAGVRAPTITVWMKDNKGNAWKEDNYGGYGEFGGKDYFQLLAEMNGLESCRTKGIDLVFDNKPHFAPNLVRDAGWEWRDEKPRPHHAQGYWPPEMDQFLAGNVYLDHIKPLLAGHMKKILSHNTNFQPLLKKDNLTKSNNWNDIDEEHWRRNIYLKSDHISLYWPNACGVYGPMTSKGGLFSGMSSR